MDFTQLKDNLARGLHCCIYGVSNVKNIIVTQKFRLDEGVRVRGEDYLLEIWTLANQMNVLVII